MNQKETAIAKLKALVACIHLFLTVIHGMFIGAGVKDIPAFSVQNKVWDLWALLRSLVYCKRPSSNTCPLSVSPAHWLKAYARPPGCVGSVLYIFAFNLTQSIVTKSGITVYCKHQINWPLLVAPFQKLRQVINCNTETPLKR